MKFFPKVRSKRICEKLNPVSEARLAFDINRVTAKGGIDDVLAVEPQLAEDAMRRCLDAVLEGRVQLSLGELCLLYFERKSVTLHGGDKDLKEDQEKLVRLQSYVDMGLEKCEQSTLRELCFLDWKMESIRLNGREEDRGEDREKLLELKQKLFSLFYRMGLPPFQGSGEDQERLALLWSFYMQTIKEETKIKVKCPVCKRSVKGFNEAVVGDTAQCPKCKADFTVEQWIPKGFWAIIEWLRRL